MSSGASYLTLMGLGVSTLVLLCGAAILFGRTHATGACLQLAGTVGLLTVVLAHAAEGLHLLPSMGWGLPHSFGHYIDLGGAVLGLTMFPIGYLIHALALRRRISSSKL